ncbi:hypothetical protein L6164_010279 [Bauhinia variegata]|uniref:Uncharacterized protein n=1 Tax=Bauhinia variegata TaxID=167791 RepID=A0ACB9PP17_BAUVA|nr:hypothetical protein L6164_010279 [Bauhinia variegata]
MKNVFPGITLNVRQVVNKMKRWSSKLNEVVDMMNTSGFGWDDTRKCVMVDSHQVLLEYLEKHPKVGNHVNKEFKEFERLQGIFGKDRANGLGAESAADAIEGDNVEAEHIDEEDWLQNNNSPTSAPNTSIGHESTSGAPLPKRQRLAHVASKFLESFEIKMDTVTYDFAKVISKMPDPPKSGLVEEVKKLGLTEEEEIDLVIKFSQNHQYEKFFWEFQGNQRMSFVRKIMRM